MCTCCLRGRRGQNLGSPRAHATERNCKQTQTSKSDLWSTKSGHDGNLNRRCPHHWFSISCLKNQSHWQSMQQWINLTARELSCIIVTRCQYSFVYLGFLRLGFLPPTAIVAYVTTCIRLDVTGEARSQRHGSIAFAISEGGGRERANSTAFPQRSYSM